MGKRCPASGSIKRTENKNALMKYSLIYSIFLMLVFHTSCGQNKTEPHKDNINYSIKDTVTSYGHDRMVRNIKKGSNGTILFTSAGVFRYDGKLFTKLTSKIGSRRYWDVLEDRRGNLWFTSTDSGVYNYNGKTFLHFTTKEGLASNMAMSIYEDKAGNIWFGTGGGASRYDGRSFRNFTTKEGLSDNNLTTIMEDKTGKLWFGTRGELCFYDGKTFTVLKDKDGKSFKNVWSIIEDKKGNIWFGVNGGRANGLWRYDGSAFTNVSQRGVFAMVEDKNGNIWITGEVNAGGGVWAVSRYDQKSLYNKKPTVTEIMSGPPAILGLFAANDGSIWIGASGGLYRYDGKTITDFRSKEGQQ
jgi:ligand-binding sensor domain-containing protein